MFWVDVYSPECVEYLPELQAVHGSIFLMCGIEFTYSGTVCSSQALIVHAVPHVCVHATLSLYIVC